MTYKGLIQLIKYKQNPNKICYSYLITHQEVEQKVRLTFSSLKRKIEEYKMLKKIIIFKEDAKYINNIIYPKILCEV